MKIQFPDAFFFGTSTAAPQIETAFEHDWQGVKARHGFVFDRTTDHEKRFQEDAGIIASLAPNYRMSLQWSKLQREPYGTFHRETAQEYHAFIQDLKAKGVDIMMVLHHFTNPLWFSRLGGWEKEENIPYWVDFARKVVDEFGEYVSFWNTFNEPNVYASYGWITAFFPPFKINPLLAGKVVKNMGLAHDQVYDYIKEKFPTQPVGISHNATVFSAENLLGWFPARLSDWWFMEYVPSHFEKADFFGMSYYGRIPHDPLPITFLETPEKMKALGRRHDDIWEYHPEGLRTCIDRYWNKYKKPIIITENGVCDESDFLRLQAIQDYALILHEALQDGIDIKGYYFWSTWDNFEWHLGPSMRFGLYECDPVTMHRRRRPSGDLFASLAYTKKIRVAVQKKVAS
ncbi:beta-glucosidase [Chryseolinea serpens]|uniref:Beta-glucosidase n=1 Tax=Chryseolinea serpens TaxID=947013 RepID=A0A1M5JYE2_9BACT|nr:family 1 glycosylhydrolase [Chryseolinea serpens]SHG45544.1 beta-glucosidase [Chryseolinea serpens]